MRTIGVIAVVMAFGVSFAMLAGSGVGDEIFGQDEDSIDAGHADSLEDSADEADVGGEGIEGEVGGADEPTVTGFVFSGAQFVVTLVVSIAALPFTLMNLGFPSYFAVPVGSAAQIVGAIGIFQFLTGRELL